ncbi:MAG: helix-turn-helix transcriptional regulator [Capsulimonadales bacterium]|nr:helix-turn-helix transcriptional regulator [Capsulimonadales bacterium]
MPKTFGDWLKEEREKRGLSQNQLADLSGVDASTVNKYESGLVEMPRKGTVKKLASGLSSTGIPMPETEALAALANSFSPTDELIRERDPDMAITIERYSGLGKPSREVIDRIVEAMFEKEKGSSGDNDAPVSDRGDD